MCVALTGVQALGDRGRFDQVASAQVAGDEMVEVFHQVLPPCSSHVAWSFETDSMQRRRDTFKLLTKRTSNHNNEEGVREDDGNLCETSLAVMATVSPG